MLTSLKCSKGGILEWKVRFILLSFIVCLKERKKKTVVQFFFLENLELSTLVLCILLKLIVFVFEELLILTTCRSYELANIWKKDVNLFLLTINL